jgi:signal transduction histidine kinase/CheY-like chemotaxis protein
MNNRTSSIAKTFILYAGLPMVLVLCLLIGLLISDKFSDYQQGKAELEAQLNGLVLEMSEFPGDRINEIEAIRGEHVRNLNQDFLLEVTFALAILMIGIAIPVIASKYIASMVEQNLNLLGDRWSSGGSEGSSLLPQLFDFAEFNGVAAMMRDALYARAETEQQWKHAEKELVGVNNDLLNKTQELSQGGRVAFSMMEDAEIAQRELEQVNQRLSLVIEEARASAQEAEIANNAKSEFLATISHEIRTPLNGVIGFIDMLAETKLDEEQLDYVDTARSSSNTLMALISDVLDFSKIESGFLNLEVRTFNLVTMLREVVSLFFNDATQKGIMVNIEIGDEVARSIAGDETRIRQILTNLMANAVKFTSQGEIRIIVICDSVPDASGKYSIEFEIRDTGIGIDSQQLRKLFRPFSQGDSSTTRKYGGTGLGLVICKRLAEAMRGKVWATSRVAKGSSFFARIPVEVVEQSENLTPGSMPLKQSRMPEPEARSRQQLGDEIPLKIAIAEDNQANQRLLVMMLRSLGWQAECNENGVELIEYLKDNDCDLIFMDLQMPEMGGLEATALIRQGAAGDAMKDVKIVALTANALSSDEARCLKGGMDAYLSKPLKIALLKQRILELFAPSEVSATKD